MALELSKFLMAYRSTPHVSTGASPYFLMFGREMRTKLPALDFGQAEHQLMEEIRDRDWINKMKRKEYFLCSEKLQILLAAESVVELRPCFFRIEVHREQETSILQFRHSGVARGVRFDGPLKAAIVYREIQNFSCV